jgi:hypothetical protein
MPRLGKLSMTLAGMSLLGLGCVGNVMEGRQAGPAGTNPPGNGNTGNGNTGNGNGNTGNGNGNTGTPAPPTPPGPGVPGQAAFRRLTKAEYNNTVRDLIGDTTSPANNFPNDTLSFQSGYNKGGVVSNVDAERIFEATEKMAADVIGKRLGSVLPCQSAPTADADAEKCATDFIAKFGQRAFRRPLTAPESAAYLDLYKQQRGEVKNDFTSAVRVVLSAMMMSPSFLYRWETVTQGIVKDGGSLRFNGWEVASRLSYGLWASMPDEGLFTAAAGDKLKTPEQLEGEVRRMLKDPKARDAFADFMVQWLDISDLKEQQKAPDYKTYNAAVAAAMLEESKTFIANVMQKGDGKLGTLLTSKISYIDAGLAALYGKTGITGTTLTETEVNPAQRAGILTHGAFLAAHAKADESGPVHRGKAIADRVLCKELPSPPDNVPPPKEPLQGVTTRQRFEDHSSSPCAAACHNILDPLGFAYENYDAVGAWRMMDMGQPVNAAATVEIDGKKVNFANGIELGSLMAGSQDAVTCMARQWMRYVLRRREVAGDEGSILQAADSFGKSGNDIRELLVALTKTKSFTHRTASAGELLP